MSSKVTSEHLGRIAVVYVRESTMAQVTGNLESQRRHMTWRELRKARFASVTVIEDDLGRYGSGSVQRPGFERLVAMVCSGDVGAVYCIEASRLARNRRDWHHLIGLCALAGAVVIDSDGAYDPRLVNDRLLLGLKGTMSEYELSLVRQRGIAARDSKARRGEYRFKLPPGFCCHQRGRSTGPLARRTPYRGACRARQDCRYPTDMAPTAVDALRKLAGHWPDQQLAVSLNLMRCKTGNGEIWITVRVREMRERLGPPNTTPPKLGLR
ncbi:recombinase family protein [Bradyrhizobium sp. 173]|uniref:recombinase family protein n=1 Tax=Bradyrhizobium sp. 173 TaxID=2782644 RepID=UPI001FF7D3E1|nr:recombinase family protein [Bradyrhizobium sp. 173]MCK1562412.1 recombinase family protein [Bradyrhizobium sp. 173]